MKFSPQGLLAWVLLILAVLVLVVFWKEHVSVN